MKKTVILGMLVLTSLTYSRGFTHNARRDILKPIIEKETRVSRMNWEEYTKSIEAREANILANQDFHNQLERADNRGEESQR